MMATYHVGQRLSFKSSGSKSFLCTVRYVGKIEGTDESKEWLGIEWDDPSRGKHDGERGGKRYFKCLSSSPTAGSFVSVKSSKPELSHTFVEAVRIKYATDDTTQSTHQVTVISGKTVEEVGFEKIQNEQAQLENLKVVLVDGLRIGRAAAGSSIRNVCPSIVDLDLSRNLFEDCREVVNICGELNGLKSLRLNGNRFRVAKEDLEGAIQAFKGVTTLELDETLLSWDDLCTLAAQFESLRQFTASSNSLASLKSPLTTQIASTLTSLTLEYNGFTSLDSLLDLRDLSSLESLHLKGNQIWKLGSSREKGSFAPKLHYVDLSYNKVHDWDFVDGLADFFPGLTALRFSHNPIYDAQSRITGSASSADDGYMLTLARIGNLKTLNFSYISPEERKNAEMFYLSRIGLEMTTVPESEEHTITSKHKRYTELCEIYGAPVIVRKSAESINPDFLEARLIKFTLYLPPNTLPEQDEAITKVQEIPKRFDIYRVKGIVGRLFGLRPLGLRLVWETGEWDPVAGYEDEVEGEDDEDSEDEEREVVVMEKGDDKGRWMKREVEIEDGTRQIGFCVDGMEAIVRIELR